MNPRSQRGSALITAVVVVLVMTVIAIGIARIGLREVAGATAGRNHQAMVACAEAARARIYAQFHALGFNPSAIEALNVPIDPGAGGSAYAVGGHYGADPTTDAGRQIIQIAQVQYLPDSAFGPVTTPRNLTNVSSLVAQGGRPLKVVVHCQDGTAGGGRQLEVEFGIRFGL